MISQFECFRWHPCCKSLRKYLRNRKRIPIRPCCGAGLAQQRLSAIEAGARRLDVLEFLHLTGALGLSLEAAIQLAVPKAGPSTRSRQVRKRG